MWFQANQKPPPISCLFASFLRVVVLHTHLYYSHNYQALYNHRRLVSIALSISFCFDANSQLFFERVWQELAAQIPHRHTLYIQSTTYVLRSKVFGYTLWDIRYTIYKLVVLAWPSLFVPGNLLLFLLPALALLNN